MTIERLENGQRFCRVLRYNGTVYVSGLTADDLSGDGFQTRGVVHNPNQRWYYFSNMLPSDLMLFKGYDSENIATPPHASFLNQTLAGKAYPRESVEGRFFCYFE